MHIFGNQHSFMEWSFPNMVHHFHCWGHDGSWECSLRFSRRHKKIVRRFKAVYFSLTYFSPTSTWKPTLLIASYEHIQYKYEMCRLVTIKWDIDIREMDFAVATVTRRWIPHCSYFTVHKPISDLTKVLESVLRCARHAGQGQLLVYVRGGSSDCASE